MKVTKRAKYVDVKWEEVKTVHKISEYQCPACKAVYRNTLNTRMIRFRCDCGQELIIS